MFGLTHTARKGIKLMRQYRYILFKNERPWKGFFDELDFMNEYDRAFQNIKQTAMHRWSANLSTEMAIVEFFRTIQPAIYVSKHYRSLLGEYILGKNPGEGSIIYGIDWLDMNLKERALFKYYEEEFSNLLNTLKEPIVPEYGVSRGTGALTKLN